jgi:hypothetical protein
MARIRERTRIKSRVDELGEDARAKLDGMLTDVTISYAEISDALKADGYEISKSAIGRYAMRSNRAAARLQNAAAQTRALLEVLKDHQGLDISGIATTLVMDGVMQELATASAEDYSAIPLPKLIEIAQKQERNEVYKSRLTRSDQQRLDQLRRALVAEMAAQIQDDPELVKRIEAAAQTAAEKMNARGEESE